MDRAPIPMQARRRRWVVFPRGLRVSAPVRRPSHRPDVALPRHVCRGRYLRARQGRGALRRQAWAGARHHGFLGGRGGPHLDGLHPRALPRPARPSPPGARDLVAPPHAPHPPPPPPPPTPPPSHDTPPP